MALAINTTNGCSLSNKAHHELLLKQQGNSVLAVHFAVRNQLYITNKTEYFSFRTGHDVRVSKFIKEDWPIVLW